MANALVITLVGMGLVFIAILLLWGIMALLVRLTSEPEPVSQEAGAAEEVVAPALLPDRKRRAAAIAVAVALSLRDAELAKQGPKKPPVSVSAWQAFNRAWQISQRDHSARKKVVR